MFDGSLRKPIDAGLRPVGEALRRAGISADVITGAGIVMSIACAVAIASGHLVWAVVLLALAGVPDALDGAVARAGGVSSTRGAFLDSVSDRFTDAIIFGGVAWYLAGRGGHIVMLPFALYAAASLVSYQRAKAESLGFDAKGGLMERAERFFVLGFGLAFSSLLVPVLWVMLALTAFTAVQRFIKVWGQTDRPPPRSRHHRRTRRPARPRGERWLQPRATRAARAGRRRTGS